MTKKAREEVHMKTKAAAGLILCFAYLAELNMLNMNIKNKKQGKKNTTTNSIHLKVILLEIFKLIKLHHYDLFAKPYKSSMISSITSSRKFLLFSFYFKQNNHYEELSLI